MNIKKIKKQLLTYLKNNYDLTDSNILRKYEHIQTVADYSSIIATMLNLSKKDQKLAYVLGLFHDYGRFEQWKLYKTYNDSLSVSHAHLGTQLLFTQNQISYFSVPQNYHNLLEIAINEHSSLAIDPTIKNERIKMFCKIIRNADKSNLYELYISGAIPIFTNLDGVSIEVIEAIQNNSCVDTKFVKTKLDRALLTLSSIYDLDYDFAFNKLKEIDYFNKLKERFIKILNEEDYKILVELVEKVEKSIINKNT